MKRIAIFASGSGTNAENIIEYFSKIPDITVEIVLSNKKDAFVLQRAARFGVDTYVFTKKDLNETTKVENELQRRQIDLIVLAGFLLLIPKKIINLYPKRIINIHPALLPKYGGKGMYGENVHKAVLKNQEKFSGITIHYVNEKYDDGDIIFQAKCSVNQGDTADLLAEKIHKLEYENYPEIIHKILKKL
jgi:phosphoribosylglycinamide formyltransferase-1